MALGRENTPASNGRDVLGVGSSVALRHWSTGWLTAWWEWDVTDEVRCKEHQGLKYNHPRAKSHTHSHLP